MTGGERWRRPENAPPEAKPVVIAAGWIGPALILAGIFAIFAASVLVDQLLERPIDEEYWAIMAGICLLSGFVALRAIHGRVTGTAKITLDEKGATIHALDRIERVSWREVSAFHFYRHTSATSGPLSPSWDEGPSWIEIHQAHGPITHVRGWYAGGMPRVVERLVEKWWDAVGPLALSGDPHRLRQLRLFETDFETDILHPYNSNARHCLRALLARSRQSGSLGLLLQSPEDTRYLILTELGFRAGWSAEGVEFVWPEVGPFRPATKREHVYGSVVCDIIGDRRPEVLGVFHRAPQSTAAFFRALPEFSAPLTTRLLNDWRAAGLRRVVAS